MKLYDTADEAKANAVPGEVLFIATLGGATAYGSTKASNRNSIVQAAAKLFGLSVRNLEARPPGTGKSFMTKVRSVPKSDALAMIDKLRAEVEARKEES